MIARFSIFTESPIYIPIDANLAPFMLVREGRRVRVFPPRQAAISPEALRSLDPAAFGSKVEGLRAATQPVVARHVLLNDGHVYRANLLVIDFFGDEFDRRADSEGVVVGEGPQTDPPLELAFAVANEILTKIRVLSRAQEVKPVRGSMTFWRLDYLDDREERLPRVEGLLRTKVATQVRFQVAALTRALWGSVTGLPDDFTDHTWDALLLDAEALLPDVGPAIAVANASLEIFSTWAIDQLQTENQFAPDGLWDWIFHRGDWYQNPSVEDRYDVLLKLMTGKSLKDEAQLWEGFKHLRKARNTFSHQGRPMIGNAEVSEAKAAELIAKAKAIVGWVEDLLPRRVRRPKHEEENRFQFIHFISDPPLTGIDALGSGTTTASGDLGGAFVIDAGLPVSPDPDSDDPDDMGSRAADP